MKTPIEAVSSRKRHLESGDPLVAGDENLGDELRTAISKSFGYIWIRDQYDRSAMYSYTFFTKV